jgi:hypothetical protein
MNNKEVMQMALDALESLQAWPETPENFKRFRAIEALRARLAECDGGQCGIGGYCKQCPKTQPDVPESCFGETKPVAMKFQIYKQTPPRGRELEPINSALLPWVYDQDPSSGNTASMWVTPVATLPPQREWVGLTNEELEFYTEELGQGEIGRGVLRAVVDFLRRRTMDRQCSSCGGFCRKSGCERENVQPKPEPVAAAKALRHAAQVVQLYDDACLHGDYMIDSNDCEKILTALAEYYEAGRTAPPQREWVGLTDEDIEEIHSQIKVKGMGSYKTEDIYRAIEAKLKGKNT